MVTLANPARVEVCGRMYESVTGTQTPGDVPPWRQLSVLAGRHHVDEKLQSGSIGIGRLLHRTVTLSPMVNLQRSRHCAHAFGSRGRSRKPGYTQDHAVSLRSRRRITETQHTTVTLTCFSERSSTRRKRSAEQRPGIQASVGRGSACPRRYRDDARPAHVAAGRVAYSAARPGTTAVWRSGWVCAARVDRLTFLAVAGRRFSEWRIDGNALFEKPH
jgi:hypothetical protein